MGGGDGGEEEEEGGGWEGGVGLREGGGEGSLTEGATGLLMGPSVWELLMVLIESLVEVNHEEGWWEVDEVVDEEE